MDWWGEVRLALQGFLDQHGVLAGFVLVLIEEAGVPVPVPGDFLMLALGVHARQGHVQLWQALLVLEIATLLGASVLYVAAARAGRGLVYRYGRYIHLTPERLDRAERWLGRHGTRAIVLGRLTPGLRMATVIGCGIFGVPFWRFLPSWAPSCTSCCTRSWATSLAQRCSSCWRGFICRSVCSACCTPATIRPAAAAPGRPGARHAGPPAIPDSAVG